MHVTVASPAGRGASARRPTTSTWPRWPSSSLIGAAELAWQPVLDDPALLDA
jgi:hypothetical protein